MDDCRSFMLPPPRLFAAVTRPLAVLMIALIGGCGCGPQAPHGPGGYFETPPVIVRAEQTKLAHQFNVVNTTGRHVRILGQRPSCTCTVLGFDKAELRPGEAATLSVSVFLPQSVSDIVIGCEVLTDHPEFPEWTYNLRVRTFPVLQFVTQALDLGKLRADSLDQAEGKLFVDTFHDTEDAPPLIAIHCPKEFTLNQEKEAIPQTRAEGIWQTRYTLRLHPNADVISKRSGPSAGIASADVSDGHSASATVTWEFEQPIVVTPSVVHFGIAEAAAARPLESTVSITARDGVAFRILSVQTETNNPEAGLGHVTLEPTTSTEAAEAQRIALTFHPGRGVPSGGIVATSGEVVIQTDINEAPTVHVPWSVILSGDGQASHDTQLRSRTSTEGSVSE